MKYKVVGWLDLIFGLLGLVQQTIMLFVVYPKLNALYQDFYIGGKLPFFTRAYPYITVVLIILLAGIAYIGKKLAFEKSPNEKIFKLGLMALVAVFLFGGYYISSLIMSFVSPLYSITSQL